MLHRLGQRKTQKISRARTAASDDISERLGNIYSRHGPRAWSETDEARIRDALSYIPADGARLTTSGWKGSDAAPLGRMGREGIAHLP
jgi:hypothetical protein